MHIVNTKYGPVSGIRRNGCEQYLGIPYARPPVGERMFRHPEEPEPWTEVRKADRGSANPVQAEAGFKVWNNSLDCLYLNIFVPEEKKETPRPVMVWLYGGNYAQGGVGAVRPGSEALVYDLARFAAETDTVVVALNYRLNLYGFLNLHFLDPSFDNNNGLYDQIRALEFVRDNIAAFGGDPRNVTLFGQSAGGACTLALMTMPEAKGLFQKAFVFNGNLATAYDSPDGSRALAGNLLKETQTSTMEELLKLDTKTLKDAAQRLWQDMCAPTCDGNWIPVDVDQAYRDKAASGIEFIIGIPADETGVLRSFLGRKKFDDFVSSGMTVIRQYADDSLAGEIREFMETQKKLSGESEARAKLIEQWLAIREYRSAARLSEGGNKVRLLYWNEKALIEKLGTGTVDAAASLLGNEDALQMYGSVIHQDLAEILQKLLEKFVNGDTLQLYPNEIGGVDAIDWKAFPRALVVSDDRLYCETIEDRLTEVKGLLDFMVR